MGELGSEGVLDLESLREPQTDNQSVTLRFSKCSKYHKEINQNFMTTEYQRLLNLIECLQTKIEEFSSFRINNADFSNATDKYQRMKLEKHLEIELRDLSELFSIGRNASLVLASLLTIYNFVKDIQTIQVISAEDLTYGICLEPSSIFELNEGISELECRKMILLKDVDNSKSFLNSNKSYQLTQYFVNQIINL